ncbi:MAG: hypothetical protein QOH14_2380, partial [Pseudonocardiales bacterium]|nr:hypothetical protein [Pseudonocardiales bacterium]
SPMPSPDAYTTEQLAHTLGLSRAGDPRHHGERSRSGRRRAVWLHARHG